MARNKVTVIGAGNVGATTAQRIAEAGLADVVLVDIVEGLPQGKGLDLAEAAPVVGHDARVVGTNDYADTAGSDIIVVTSGLARQPGHEPRRPAGQERRASCGRVVRAGRGAVARTRSSSSSPIRSTRCATSRCTASGFPRERVLGMAGVLDSARFRTFIAQELGVSRRGHACVRARRPRRHDGAAVALLDGGRRADHRAPARRAGQGARGADGQRRRRDRRPAQDGFGVLRPGRVDVRDGRRDPARSQARPARAPCSSQGEFGVDGLFVGVPVVLGAGGIERVIEITLTADEQAAFDASAAAVRELVDKLPA